MAAITWISTGTNAASVSWTATSNWSGGVVPTTGDTVYFTGTGSANLQSNLATGLVTLTVFVDQSYLGQIGVSSGGTNNYLQFGGVCTVGRNTGANPVPSGPRLVMIDGGSNSLTFSSLNTASSSAVTGIPPVLVKGSNLTVNHTGGTIGLATFPGETATAIVNLADGPATVNPSIFIGNGATVSSLTVSSGNVNSFSDNVHSTVSLTGASTMLMQGAGALTTVTIGGGCTFQHYGSGNVTTVNNYGIFDRTGDTRAITITTGNAYASSTWLLDNGKPSSTTRSTFTLVNARINDIKISLPIGEKP